MGEATGAVTIAVAFDVVSVYGDTSLVPKSGSVRNSLRSQPMHLYWFQPPATRRYLTRLHFEGNGTRRYAGNCNGSWRYAQRLPLPDNHHAHAGQGISGPQHHRACIEVLAEHAEGLEDAVALAGRNIGHGVGSAVVHPCWLACPVVEPDTDKSCQHTAARFDENAGPKQDRVFPLAGIAPASFPGRRGSDNGDNMQVGERIDSNHIAYLRSVLQRAVKE